VSVGAAYTAGILLSFALNSGLTFRQRRGERRLRALPRFAAIALLGLGTTSALSLALRYGLALDAVLGSLADAAAFVAAALCASVLAYSLTARFVSVRVGWAARRSAFGPAQRQQQVTREPPETQRLDAHVPAGQPAAEPQQVPSAQQIEVGLVREERIAR